MIYLDKGKRMKNAIQDLLEIKKSNPSVSFVDIINEYTENHEDFDIEAFIDKINTKECSTMFNYIRNDLINHGYKEITEQNEIMKDLF